MLEKTDSEENQNGDNPLEKQVASPKVRHDESPEKQSKRVGLRESTISDKELFYQLCNGGW